MFFLTSHMENLFYLILALFKSNWYNIRVKEIEGSYYLFINFWRRNLVSWCLTSWRLEALHIIILYSNSGYIYFVDENFKHEKKLKF